MTTIEEKQAKTEQAERAIKEKLYGTKTNTVSVFPAFVG